MARAAQIFHEDEQLLWDLALDVDPAASRSTGLNKTCWPLKVAVQCTCRNCSIDAATPLRGRDSRSCVARWPPRMAVATAVERRHDLIPVRQEGSRPLPCVLIRYEHNALGNRVP